MHSFHMSSVLRAVLLAVGLSFPTGNSLRERAPVRSERFTQLPAILLPETVAPSTGQNWVGDFVFAFIVDTTGAVNVASIQTLQASDSASAKLAREALTRARYVPARIIYDEGTCVQINGLQSHCGNSSSKIQRVRSREVLRLDFTNSSN